MILENSIFRSYDIRGIYPDELNEHTAELIGKALGTYSSKKNLGNTFVIGADNRKSSPLLASSFIAGLVSTGMHVTDMGLTLTPIIHFLTCTMPFDWGVNVTASHNPKQYNGFRIDLKNGIPFYGESLQELYKVAIEQDFITGKGSYTKKDMFPEYLAYLKDKFKFSRSTKVFIDCGNSTASAFAPKIFTELGCSVDTLYCDLNSDFPHGIPNPEDRTFMTELSSAVEKNYATVGLAFDADSDRFGLVDEQGNIYETDKLLLMYAEQLLENKPGSTVIFDVKCSQVVPDVVSQLGGVPKLLKTGHAYFVEEMQSGALLGGEYSGHIYFGNDYFGYDDGVYAACKALEYYESKNLPFSQLLGIYPKKYHTSEVTLSCPDEAKFEIIKAVTSVASKIPDVKEIIDIDGVRIRVTDDAWFLIRASNTTPKLSLRVEANTLLEAKQLVSTVKQLLSDYDNVNLEPLDSADIYLS